MTRVQNNRSLLNLQPNFPIYFHHWTAPLGSDWSHAGLPVHGKLPEWSLQRLKSYPAAVLPGSSWVNWCNRYGYSWHLPRFHKNDQLYPPPCTSFRCQERFSWNEIPINEIPTTSLWTTVWLGSLPSDWADRACRRLNTIYRCANQQTP